LTAACSLAFYLRPFPNGGPRVQVSSAGGLESLWSPAGRFLGVRVHPDANVLDRIDVVLNWFTQLPRR